MSRFKSPVYKDEVFSLIHGGCISLNLQAETKEEIIGELVDMLAVQGKLIDRDRVIRDVLEREKVLSTGMPNGVALPRAMTTGAAEAAAALGIKREGIDFGSPGGGNVRIFILTVSPGEPALEYYDFLAAAVEILGKSEFRGRMLESLSEDQMLELLRCGG